MQKKEYSLFTAVAMIVGTVIGSGIFFKSDNILVFTQGSIVNGVILFSLAAIGIIFGSLAIGVLAAKTTKAGGLITYADEYSGKENSLCIRVVSGIYLLSGCNSCCVMGCGSLCLHAFWNRSYI